jgi:hypothetical protein
LDEWVNSNQKSIAKADEVRNRRIDCPRSLRQKFRGALRPAQRLKVSEHNDGTVYGLMGHGFDSDSL